MEWKKANIVPVHKKGDKQAVKNHRPVSLLPICGKIFERLLYNEMLNFFLENDLISPKQSGFRPGDSCINQLLSINHEILSAFDIGLEVRGLFLDVSKAFDKVWHAGLIYKLRQNGICGDLINILNDFLTNRKQRVVLNGQCSSWVDIRAGVPQGSILGPLLFLIYVNDLPNGLKSECQVFADDTSLSSGARDFNTSVSDINHDLKLISDRAFQWKMSFNPNSSKQAQEITFSRKKLKSSHQSVYFNNIPVSSTTVHKHLGMLLDDKLSYEHHLQFVLNKDKRTIDLLRKFQQTLPRQSLITTYKSFIRPHLDYGDIVYDLIPPNNNVHATRSSQNNKISSFKTKHNFFNDSFFSEVIFE